MEVQQVLSGVQDALTVRRVFGDPVQADGVTLIPVACVSGAGGGGQQAVQGGVGFGLKARPAGVFVVRNGDASWRPAVDVNRIIAGGQLVAITLLLALRPILIDWLRHRPESVPERSLSPVTGRE